MKELGAPPTAPPEPTGEETQEVILVSAPIPRPRAEQSGVKRHGGRGPAQGPWKQKTRQGERGTEAQDG